MIRRPPRSTQSRSSAASDVYKRQPQRQQDREGAPVRDVSEQRLDHGRGEVCHHEQRSRGCVRQVEPLLEEREKRRQGPLRDVIAHVREGEEEEQDGGGVHRYIPSAMSFFPSRSMTSRSTPSAAPAQGGRPRRSASRNPGSTGSVSPVDRR